MRPIWIMFCLSGCLTTPTFSSGGSDSDVRTDVGQSDAKSNEDTDVADTDSEPEVRFEGELEPFRTGRLFLPEGDIAITNLELNDPSLARATLQANGEIALEFLAPGNLVVSVETDRSEYTRELEIEFRVVQIRVAETHACLLTRYGLIYCWGNNSFGMLGDSDPGRQMRPRLNPKPFVQVEAAYDKSCGITADGDAICWGHNGSNQLADDADQVLPPFLFFENVSQVSLGFGVTCVVATDGLISCRGTADGGSLVGPPDGLGGSFNTLDFETQGVPKTIDSDIFSSCVTFENNNQSTCWGNNSFNSLRVGVGASGAERLHISDFVQSPENIVMARHGGCALIEDGSVCCWGGGPFTGYNTGNFDESIDCATPWRADSGEQFLSIRGSRATICGQTESGTISCKTGDQRSVGETDFAPVYDSVLNGEQPEIWDPGGFNICWVESTDAHSDTVLCVGNGGVLLDTRTKDDPTRFVPDWGTLQPE